MGYARSRACVFLSLRPDWATHVLAPVCMYLTLACPLRLTARCHACLLSLSYAAHWATHSCRACVTVFELAAQWADAGCHACAVFDACGPLGYARCRALPYVFELAAHWATHAVAASVCFTCSLRPIGLRRLSRLTCF